MSEDELKVIELALSVLYQTIDSLEQSKGFYGDIIKNEIHYTAQHLGEILDHEFIV